MNINLLANELQYKIIDELSLEDIRKLFPIIENPDVREYAQSFGEKYTYCKEKDPIRPSINEDVYILIKTGYTSRLVTQTGLGDYYGYLAADFLGKLDEMDLMSKKYDETGVIWFEELDQRGVDWQEISDFAKVNDVLREHSNLEVAFIDDDKFFGNGVILVYDDSSDVHEIINMGCAYTDGSICFKAPTHLTFKLYELLKNLGYAYIFDMDDLETFRLSSGAKLIYMSVDSESG